MEMKGLSLIIALASGGLKAIGDITLIYIPSGPGLAIEIDDFGSHHTKIQVTNDRERQEKIRKLLNWEFVHFAATTVYNPTTRCAKQIEDWVHANTSSQAKQQLRLV